MTDLWAKAIEAGREFDLAMAALCAAVAHNHEMMRIHPPTRASAGDPLSMFVPGLWPVGISWGDVESARERTLAALQELSNHIRDFHG